MPHTVKVIEFGEEAAIILPDEVLAHMGVGIGDELEAEALADCIALRPWGKDGSKD